MSAEDQYGPSLKVARRSFIKALWKAPDGESLERDRAVAAALLAQAEETSRLADEQRTANLLTFAAFGGHPPNLSDLIRDRLGLESTQ